MSSLIWPVWGFNPRLGTSAHFMALKPQEWLSPLSLSRSNKYPGLPSPRLWDWLLLHSGQEWFPLCFYLISAFTVSDPVFILLRLLDKNTWGQAESSPLFLNVGDSFFSPFCIQVFPIEPKRKTEVMGQ